VATEELFDVQQQADFFISLGEHEQAIQVLKDHLAESQEPSALAYLDLLKLYHKLDRKTDYQQARQDFNRLFNASAPAFDQYTDRSRGLESYETALSRIQALWPQPKVLDLIEKSIFREPGDLGAEVFDMEAYRELLLLHAIAKDVIRREKSDGLISGDFEHTAIRPLNAANNRAMAAAAAAQADLMRETLPQDALPAASSNLGLDVDLDELSEFSAFEASLPEVATPVQQTAKPAAAPGAAPDFDMGHLIDFDMPDLLLPDEGAGKPKSGKTR
jgi:tetratricopeptide (TPR) repeat protein